MTKYILLLIWIFTSFSITAQQTTPEKKEVELTYESFEEVFNKEFEKTEDSVIDKETLSYLPSVTLPEWFVNFKSLKDGKILSVGISDPGLDEFDALEQAIVRALSIACFAEKSHIQNVSDNYYQDQRGSKTLGKFNSFTNYLASDTLGFEMLEYELTINGEMLVLIEVKKNTEERLSIHTNIELFQSETSGKIISRLFFKTEGLSNTGDHLVTSWLLKENSNSLEIASEWDGEAIEYMRAKHKYNSPYPATEKGSDSGSYSFEMKYGLWNAYLNALAVNMEQMEVFNSQVKFIDTQSNEEYQDLTRIIFKEKTSFYISGLSIDDNKLTLKLVKD